MAWQAIEPSAGLDAKYPEWLVFFVTHDGSGRHNLMPAGWCTQCSEQPPMVAIALRAGRYSLQQARTTGEFGVAFAGPGQVELVTWCGSHSGAEVDKFAAAGLSWQPGIASEVALVDGCSLVLECRLVGELACGDHVVITGEVVAAHRADPPLQNLVNFGGWYSPAVASLPRSED